MRPHLGLLGRILAILLLTIVIEFGASTFFYERASSFSVREDEANRLAEHLVIARSLMAERSWRERPAMARELTTGRYEIRWGPSLPTPPRVAPRLADMQQQVIAWEPSLATSDLRLRLTSPGRGAVITGGLRLPDGSWLHFSTREPIHSWELAVGRIVLALVPAIAILVIGVLLVRRTLRPMTVLVRAADRVGHGAEVDLQEAGPAEVRQVIRAFNAMQGRIHRLISDRTQALAAVGHDLRTPLSRLQLRAEAIDDPKLRRAFADDVHEMDAMVDSLLSYLGGEDDPERPVVTDVAVMLATLVDDAADRGFDTTYVGPEHLELSVRPSGLKRALANLLDNALHYGSSAVAFAGVTDAGTVLAIEDDGPGIPEDKLDEVLRPFSRLDAARQRNTRGLGLGLAIVTHAVEREGGQLTLSNRTEGGLRAEIRLSGHPA